MTQVTECTKTILFADLSGFTALTEAHGSLDAARVAGRYAELTRSILEPGTRLIKTIGDEVMVTGDEVVATVHTAIALFRAVHHEQLFPAVRMGLHVGTVVEQNGDYFGAAVNLAARVASHAGADQILCTEPVCEQCGDLPNVMFWGAGIGHFKNIAQPVSLYQIVAGEGVDAATRIDPVCRMCLREDTAPARLPFGEQTFYFCSFDCAKMFADHPEHYVAGR